MDPNQARSIRVAKRLEGQLNLNERDKFDCTIIIPPLYLRNYFLSL